MGTLATMLEGHRMAPSSEFRSAFSTLKTKLDIIHSKVEDQRTLSLESNTNAVSEHIEAFEATCPALANDNVKLKAKARLRTWRDKAVGTMYAS